MRSSDRIVGLSPGVKVQPPSGAQSPLRGPWAVCDLFSSPAGRRRASEEEDGAEQQPSPRRGHGRQGGRPERPAARPGGPVLHRRRHRGEGRLVGGRRRRAAVGWTGSPCRGI